jgi:hypothetical protein
MRQRGQIQPNRHFVAGLRQWQASGSTLCRPQPAPAAPPRLGRHVLRAFTARPLATAGEDAIARPAPGKLGRNVKARLAMHAAELLEELVSVGIVEHRQQRHFPYKVELSGHPQ